MEVTTTKGSIRLPAYLPVTTYGTAYPMDRLIRPFLSRFAQMQMVSFHYARDMTETPALPVFVDSGGFATLLQGSEVLERTDGLGYIRRQTAEGSDDVTPEAALALQLERAQWGATLDFPVPPALARDEAERSRRIRLTLANARWAWKQARGRDLRLFGSVQGFDLHSYVDCAKQMLDMGYHDLALGGFVPRISNPELLLSMARQVRALMPSGGLLHAFGIGDPNLARSLFHAGVTSVDSSSVARAAASGRRWDGTPWDSERPSPLERAHAALANLRHGVQQSGAAAPGY